MPNWCYNSITITGSTENIDNLLEEAGKRNDKGEFIDLDCDGIIPKPFKIIEVKSKVSNNTSEITIAPLEIVNSFNDQRNMIGIAGSRGEYDYELPIGYGVFDWYTWELNNYGCKWGFCQGEILNISDSERDNTKTINYTCNTAWSMPNGLMRAMAIKFKVNIEMWSEEEGNAFFLKSDYDYYDNDGEDDCDEGAEEFEDIVEFLKAKDGYSDDDVATCLHCGEKVIPDIHDWDDELQACFNCYDELDWMEDGEEKDKLKQEMMERVIAAQNEKKN